MMKTIARLLAAAFAVQPAVVAEPGPMFVEQGGRIVVPTDSPLCQRLVVVEVGTRPWGQRLSVQAVV